MADNHNWNISTDYRIETHRQGLGARAVVKLKQLVRPWVRLYTDHPLSRQAQINLYLHYLGHNLVRELVRLQVEVAALRNQAGGAPEREGERARVKVAFVVQRYGTEVVGGAELHCRWIAEHVAERHEVEVLTTTATDYLSWQNVLARRRDACERRRACAASRWRAAATSGPSTPSRTRSASSSTPTTRSGAGSRSTGR